MFTLIKELSQKKQFVLVSQSPRRKAILKEMDVNFKVELPKDDVPEIVRDKYYLKDIVNVVYDKLNSIKMGKNKILIACDTIVVYNDRVFGKPANKAEAARFLQLLSGKKHYVISCLAVKTEGTDQPVFFHEIEKTKVYFRKLSAGEINEYVNTGEPLDKAGAYAIQGQGKIFVKKISGCYYNVVGLPVYKFYKLLRKLRGK